MLWSAIGATGLGLAVMLGAFGAHGLRGKLDAYSMGIYERAVFYQFIHAIGLLVVPVLGRMNALRPSAGTLVPGRTRTISFVLSVLTETFFVPSAVTSSAISGINLASSFSAPDA